MSIYDLEATKDLVDNYNKFRQAQVYAAQWTQNMMDLSVLIQASPLFLQNASPQEQTFFTTAKQNSTIFVQALPVDPDAPVNPKPPTPPANQATPTP